MMREPSRREFVQSAFALSKREAENLHAAAEVLIYRTAAPIATWEPDARSEGDHVQSFRGRPRFARRAPSIWGSSRNRLRRSCGEGATRFFDYGVSREWKTHYD